MARTLDIAPFAYRDDSPDGRTLGFRWEEPRDIHRIVLQFAEGDLVGKPAVDYWRSHWPGQRVTLADAGGHAGWKPRDDWFNGEWQAADVRFSRHGSTASLRFHPLARREFRDLADYAVAFRQTLKLRLTLPDGWPLPSRVEMRTDTPTELRRFVVEADPAAGMPQVDVYNGELERPGQDHAGLRLAVRCAVPGPLSYDHTIVTLRGLRPPLPPGEGGGEGRASAPGPSPHPNPLPGGEGAGPGVSFSFRPSDVDQYGEVSCPELGLRVVPAGVKPCAPKPSARCIYDRIADQPEQSLARAVRGQAPKEPLHFIVGCEGVREKFGVAPNGDLFGQCQFIRSVPGRDTARMGWQGAVFALRFGWDNWVHTARSLQEGWLPIHQAVFQHGALEVESVSFAAPLTRRLADGPLEGDDALAAVVRLTFHNAGAAPLAVRQPLRAMTYDGGGVGGVSHNQAGPGRVEKLRVEGDLVLAEAERPYVRFAAELNGGELVEAADGVDLRLDLAPGESHAVTLKVPFGGLLDAAETAALRGLTFEAARDDVAAWWRARGAEGTAIRTSEPDLDDFYRAHLTHVLINDDREPGSDRLMGRVSSFHYGNFSNESVMQITDLDRRGYHDQARRHYETFLHYQSTVPLPGNFQGHEGVFYGSGGYQHGDYNQHHGWVLWGLAEHYRYTGDRAWLLSIADRLVKGCDWVLREREGTRTAGALEDGFLPAGTLEDVRDYYYWLTTNAMTVRGMLNAGEVLVDAGHAEGKRILEGAKEYQASVRRGFDEAMVRSPVVRLRDGSFVPHIPSRLYWRGRDFGWIREVLEGSINLIGPILEPGEPASTWVLKDYEDNRYLDAPYNYPLADFEREWFSCGGFSMQPNLVYFPPPYLYRDQVEHFLRAFYNGFAACWRSDIRTMAEHALPTLWEWAGDHFKSSDEAMVAWWLRLMFAQEVGETLYLGRGIPRAWLRHGEQPGIERAQTYFGELSVAWGSRADEGVITARAELPSRRVPERIYLRFRHPEKVELKRVQVDGKDWQHFDAEREWVELTGVSGAVEVVAQYR